MASFLEKLKKGMNIKEVPKIEKDLPEEDLPEEGLPEENLPSIQKTPPKETLPPKLETPEPSLTAAFLSIKSQETKSTRKKGETAKKSKKKSKVEKVKIKEEKPKTKESSPVKPPEEKEEWFEPEGQLVVDVYQTGDKIVIQSAIAGVRPEDLDISIENDVVTIKGKRERSFGSEEANYFYQECYWGNFSREIILPTEVDGKRAEATIKNGILTIKIPKIEREGKKRITVRE